MRTYFLDIPFEMRGARFTGTTYDRKLKKMVFTGESLPVELEPYRSRDFSLLRWEEDNYNKSILPAGTLPYKMTPRPHQKEAAIKIVRAAKAGYRGFIEGDATGLGKTIASAFGIYGLMKTMTPKKKANVLVICPKSVIEHWGNTFKALGVPNIRLCVLNYDQSNKLLKPPASANNAKKQRTKNRHTALKGTPTVKWDYIIFDESQNLKNWETAARARAAGNIARYSESTGWPFVIYSSATIGQNPLELRYLFPVLKQITKSPHSMSWKAWLEKYGFHVKETKKAELYWVKPDPKLAGADAKDIEKQRKHDLALLNKMLFSPNSPSVRRTPVDIEGWPEIQRIAQGQSLSPMEYVEYNAEWLRFRAGYKLQMKGKNPVGALAQQLRFRQKSSLIRTPHTVSAIEDLLDNGLQVAVFSEFMESIDKMREALKKKGIDSAEFTGRNVEEREAERISFQKGHKKVIFFSVDSGISLHAGEGLPDGSKASSAGRATLVHDVTYSGIKCSQIEGRCHRDGQFAPVYYLYALNTAEEKIAKVMVERVQGIMSIMDDETFASRLDGLLAS